jgi:isopenicillin-N epimerase
VTAGQAVSGNTPFGAGLRDHFSLEPGTRHLNHGSYGAVPKAVRAAEDAWRDRLEANPTRFFAEALGPGLRAAAERVADMLGGRGQDWIFVENATTAINAVVAGLRLKAGDELLTTGHVYGAVRNTLNFHAARAGARVVEVALSMPATGEEAIVDAIRQALSPRTVFAIFDHVTSASATILPVAELARLCRERGVAVMIDGAHAPGMLALDVPALGVDWYTGNAHKWLFAPRGSGLLWTAPQHQATTHPTVISHGLGRGYVAEFDWTGTRDPAAWLSVPEGIAFHRALGSQRVRDHNRGLALAGGRLLAQAFQTELAAPPAMLGSMASVRLPAGLATEGLRQSLRAQDRIEAVVHRFAGTGWVRVSAQVYNELGDYQALADAILRRHLANK